MFNDGLVDALEFYGVALIRLIPTTCQHNHSKGLQFETRGNTTSTTMTWKLVGHEKYFPHLSPGNSCFFLIRRNKNWFLKQNEKWFSANTHVFQEVMEVLLTLKRHLKAIDLELDTAQRVAKIEAPRCRHAGTRDKRKMRIGWKVSHGMMYVFCFYAGNTSRTRLTKATLPYTYLTWPLLGGQAETRFPAPIQIAIKG